MSLKTFLARLVPQTLLVYGGNGFVGTEFEPFLNQTHWKIVHSICRIGFSTVQEVEAELDFVAPDRVLCYLGKTRGGGCKTIDYLEQPGKLLENVVSNLFAPMWLAMSCARRKIHMTFFSTGCIYEDTKESEPFTEEDPPNFSASSYSTVKSVTDQLMRHPLLKEWVLSVRIRMPLVGKKHPFDFVCKIMSYEKVINVPNSMSVLPTLFPALLDMIQKKTTGTINLCNPGVISHVEVLELVKEIVDPTFEYKTFTIEEQDKILLSGRSNNTLSTARLSQLYPTVPPIRQAVCKALRTMTHHVD